MHPYTDYWNRGVRNVPDMTGAKHLLDARDLKAIFQALGLSVPFEGYVIDVGCGTGRLAQLVADRRTYVGYDISPSMVEYCRAAGLDASLIDGPQERLTADVLAWCDLVTCISVFTHIDRQERRRYLAWFAGITTRALVDIIPGDGSGDVALWTAQPDEFMADCEAAGFRIAGDVTQAWDMHHHRYFLLERV